MTERRGHGAHHLPGAGAVLSSAVVGAEYVKAEAELVMQHPPAAAAAQSAAHLPAAHCLLPVWRTCVPPSSSHVARITASGTAPGVVPAHGGAI